MKFENIERAATLYKNYQAAIEKEKKLREPHPTA